MKLLTIYAEPNLNVIINGLTIDKNTLSHCLADNFDLKSIKANIREEKDVPVDFASYTLIENGLTLNITIRFERNQIISLSISISEFDNNYNPKIEYDFYYQIPQREKLYKKWLSEHMDMKITDFNTSLQQYGIGIGRNKSEEICILVCFASTIV